MEAAVRHPRRKVLVGAAAIVAVGFFLVMMGTGGTRHVQSLVTFEAAGLLRETPDQIDGVEFETSGRRLAFARRHGGWQVETSSAMLTSGAASHLEASLKLMHAAAPVRVMSRDEYQTGILAEYGLDPPRYVISVRRSGTTVLSASFGARNPQNVLQYVRLEGHEELYLLPVFVGREWEQVAEGVPP